MKQGGTGNTEHQQRRRVAGEISGCAVGARRLYQWQTAIRPRRRAPLKRLYFNGAAILRSVRR
jgi:hypothetical protein